MIIKAASALMAGELLLAIWVAGMLFALGRVLWHMHEMQLLLREACDLDIAALVPVKSPPPSWNRD